MPYDFFCYCSENGKCDVLDDYNSASPSIQAGLDAALDYLKNLRRDKWTNPRKHAARLDKQDWPDFYEIRFFADKVQQRPIGFFGRQPDEFTFVLWCIEQNGRLKPKSWFNTCNSRRLAILDSTATTKDLYPVDDE